MQIIAVVACVVAAVLGVVSLTSHSSSLQSIVGYVADVWVLGWVVVNKAYTREYWTAINRPFRELVQEPPPRSSGLGQVASFGMIALVILDTVLWFV
jgi:hypothetical protein